MLTRPHPIVLLRSIRFLAGCAVGPDDRPPEIELSSTLLGQEGVDHRFAAYQGGVVSLIEVLDTDSKLLQACDAKARAQTEAARAVIASFRALGGGWNTSSNRLSGDLSTANQR